MVFLLSNLAPYPYLVFTLYVLVLFNCSKVLADDILGCNGFIKSDIDINFSKVELKLFTKQGSLKDQTECAPNNGYYFLPLYDKGDYILKVSPPEGWSFEPLEVHLSVDGVNDPCSQGKDINFMFKGFAVTGKVVSSGNSEGPEGVKVELLTESDEEPVSVGTTAQGGGFTFTPVLTGRYIVRASHHKWRIENNAAKVEVSGGNGLVSVGKLSVAGYDVSGSVTSDDQPITGVSFILFTKLNTPIKSRGCSTEALPGFKASSVGAGGWRLVCHVGSDETGTFLFPELPPAEYLLVPYYSTQATFDVQPSKLAFTLHHSSLKLTTPFQVRGFTVVGQVLWSAGGQPMSDATILLDDKPVAKTGQDGIYHLDSMKAATYKIQVVAEGVEFKAEEVKVTATRLGDLVPSKYRVCGRLEPPFPSATVLLSVTPPDGTPIPPLATQPSGSYCTFLAPGTYSFSVSLPQHHNQQLQYSPVSKTVKVVDNIISDINFSQLKCTIEGQIICMTVCPLIKVYLRPRSSGNTLHTIAKGGKYEFLEVMPGDYDVYIDPEVGWCWEKETHHLVVSSHPTVPPVFNQSGFTCTIVSSHPTKVVYYRPEGGKKESLEVGQGSTHVCVGNPGGYLFEPQGCHAYSEKVIKWSSGPVVLNAIAHESVYYILTSHPSDDLVITYQDSQTNAPVVLRPIEVSQRTEGVKYEVKLSLKDGEKVTLVPKASLLLFTPPSYQVTGGSDCFTQLAPPLFTAEKGHILKGKVTSKTEGLGGVTLNVLDEEGGVMSSQITLPDGTYKFPPMKLPTNYKVIAEKEGYVVTLLPNQKENFNAHKLAEIIVTVIDEEDSQPLKGVLLSLSGGENYRRNAQTKVNGTMNFISLSPGDYYLRPMMKEYRFNPQSKMIHVTEGATLQVSLSGGRVLYSGLGRVVSLTGEGEGGVLLEAVGLANCSIYQEETQSLPNGQFRIRGLHPYCEYNVRVVDKPDVNQHINKAASQIVPIKMGSSDVNDIKVYAMRPGSRTDVVVYIVGERWDELKTLRLRLIRTEESGGEETTVHQTRLSEYRAGLSSLLLTLPSVPLNPAAGYLLSLESSLSKSTHQYTLRPIHFKPDAPLKLFRFTFAPRSRSQETELSQPSYFGLPLVLLVIACYVYRETVLRVATFLMSARFPSNSASDDSGSETFLETFPKRKNKLKKP